MASDQLRVKSDYSSQGPKCPFCGHVITPDEEFFFKQERYELQCDECDGYFEVQTEMTVSWYSNAKTWEAG